MALKEIRGSKVNLSRAYKDVGIGLLINTFTKDIHNLKSKKVRNRNSRTNNA